MIIKQNYSEKIKSRRDGIINVTPSGLGDFGNYICYNNAIPSGLNYTIFSISGK